MDFNAFPRQRDQEPKPGLSEGFSLNYLTKDLP